MQSAVLSLTIACTILGMGSNLHAAAMKLKKDVPTYGSDQISASPIPEGTEIDVSDTVDANGMVSVVYTNAEGEMMNTLCKAIDLGRNPKPTVVKPASKPESPPTSGTPAPPVEAEPAVTDEGWASTTTQAFHDSELHHRMILIYFTSSDSCALCQKIDAEILNQQEFMDYAKKNVILLKADFPKQTVPSEEIQKQNQELASKYKVTKYPTILLVDTKGKPVGKADYMEGGPAAFISELEKIKKYVW